MKNCKKEGCETRMSNEAPAFCPDHNRLNCSSVEVGGEKLNLELGECFNQCVELIFLQIKGKISEKERIEKMAEIDKKAQELIRANLLHSRRSWEEDLIEKVKKMEKMKGKGRYGVDSWESWNDAIDAVLAIIKQK